MSLAKPALANVNPGEPVTAQGWNAVVNGLDDLYDAVLAIGTGVLQVSVVSGGSPVAGASVVGVPVAGGNPVAAIPPYGEVGTYQLTGISPGNWRLFVRAPGFQPATQDVAAPSTDPVTVTLSTAGVAVPDLFGVAAQDALAQLSTAGITVDLILDIAGHEVSRTQLPPQSQNSPVLLQLPAAGTVIDTASGRMRLVIAAAIDQVPVVTMPSLIGLTQDEVATVLNQLGLILGKTTVRSIGPATE